MNIRTFLGATPRTFLAIALTGLVFLAPTAATHATEAAWARLAQGGYTILLGHGRTLGNGEPLRPDTGDCAGVKTLSDRGIQSARRLGMRFAARAVSITAILSGDYCRAQETAALAFSRSKIETRAYLNPPAEDADPSAFPPDLIAAIETFSDYGNQLMITHPALIRALTGTLPRQGEAVIVAPGPTPGGRPRVVARLLLD